MTTRQKLLLVAGVAALGLFVTSLPWERESNGISQFLYTVGDQQEEFSDDITSAAVSGVEGDLVGTHEIDGSNWSIPNIIRHWLGG